MLFGNVTCNEPNRMGRETKKKRNQINCSQRKKSSFIFLSFARQLALDALAHHAWLPLAIASLRVTHSFRLGRARTGISATEKCRYMRKWSRWISHPFLRLFCWRRSTWVPFGGETMNELMVGRISQGCQVTSNIHYQNKFLLNFEIDSHRVWFWMQARNRERKGEQERESQA